MHSVLRFVVGIIALVLPLMATADIINVPGDQPTIQAGIDAAINGDTVLVADGTYTGDGNRDMDFGGKAITVKSENGPTNCIIDCGGSEVENHRAFYFHTSEGHDSVVDGFTITNGYAYWGGAILCDMPPFQPGANPTITNCIIYGNVSVDDGGAIEGHYSAPRVINNRIEGNTAGMSGGGINYGGSLTGGDMPIVANNVIINNQAASSAGGIAHYTEDWGERGALIINNIIAGNTSGHGGGGILCSNGASTTIIGNSIVNNSSGRGGGIEYKGNSIVTVENTILWGNHVSGDGAEVYIHNREGFATFSISYSDLSGGLSSVYVDSESTLNWGAGMIETDPLFITGPAGDFYLSQIAAGQGEDSPCLDAGNDLAQNICFSVPNGSFCMNHLTTRTDQVTDTGQVDMGCHFNLMPVSSNLACTPDTGTLPFTTQVCVSMNNIIDFHRTFAGRMDLTLSSGTYFSNWRVGYTNMSPYENYMMCWNQQLPALGSLLGENLLELKVQDVTSAPYNQPPYPPAGDTDSAACTVIGLVQ